MRKYRIALVVVVLLFSVTLVHVNERARFLPIYWSILQNDTLDNSSIRGREVWHRRTAKYFMRRWLSYYIKHRSEFLATTKHRNRSRCPSPLASLPA